MVSLHPHNLCEISVSNLREAVVIRIFISINFVKTKADYCSDFNAKKRILYIKLTLFL